jgi:predicted RNA-binding Zn-ribbon protein involved in translation (DUF1610 family)
VPIGRLPTEFNCPQCGAILYQLSFYNGFFGCLLINPLLHAICRLRCPKCGRIDSADISDKQ